MQPAACAGAPCPALRGRATHRKDLSTPTTKPRSFGKLRTLVTRADVSNHTPPLPVPASGQQAVVELHPGMKHEGQGRWACGMDHGWLFSSQRPTGREAPNTPGMRMPAPCMPAWGAHLRRPRAAAAARSSPARRP